MSNSTKTMPETNFSENCTQQITPMHKHIDKIRKGMWPVLIFFAAFSIIPIALELLADADFSVSMLAGVAAPIPFLIYCVVFAPLLHFGTAPKDCTEEWKSMHIFVPITTTFVICGLYMFQVIYFWNLFFVQTSKNDFTLIIQGVVFSLVIFALYIFRCPKHLRKNGTISMLVISFALALSFPYFFNGAFCSEPQHYPAEIKSIQAKSTKKITDQHKITFVVQDGKTACVNVVSETYKHAVKGDPLDVCLRKSILGVNLFDLHPPIAEETV